jgi:TolA-binding protein
MKHISTSVAVLVLLTAGAPAAAQNREHQQQSAELRILQEQQVQLALSMAQLAQSLAESNKALTARLDQMSERLTRLFADQALLIGPIGENARIMRERSQETSTRIGELTEEIRALRRDVAALLARPVMTVAPPVDPLAPIDPNAPALPSPSTVLTPPAPTPLPSALGLSPEQQYNSARSDYASGEWDLAISGFETFIRSFPDDPRADDAQQGIGDVLYSANKFEEAIVAYNLVIQNYPRGDQVAWAYYKRGIVQRRVDRPDEARASLDMAIKLGNDQVTQLAKQQLDGLARTAPPAAQRP